MDWAGRDHFKAAGQLEHHNTYFTYTHTHKPFGNKQGLITTLARDVTTF